LRDAKGHVFSDLTVVGFAWAIVGPLTLKLFADYGARVIRVESQARPCVTRTSSPYKDGRPGLNRSGYFNFYNANMTSLSLNMSHPKARGIALRLVEKADIVVENFTPGVMERWGLGYEELRQLKPDIIMVRQSGFGSSGPYARMPAYGMVLSAISGLLNFVGWPEDEPIPLGVAPYTDAISPRFAVASVLAALEHREKTGQGMLIELSQFETAIHFVLPGIVRFATEGREPLRSGNRCRFAAPSNVYRCKGEDRFCAITVFDDAQWQSLCEVIGREDLLLDSRFSSFEGRKTHEVEIDSIIEEWTVRQEAEQVVQALQEKGVPAGVVKDVRDLSDDPQLIWRQMFWTLTHGEVGPFRHLGASFLLSETQAEAQRASPLLGEHTEEIATKIIGLSDEEFVQLLNEGVFE
jgi:crotonobetainyl-CoA:carnitine CoA-transferase CaiB-like acyl-CoA transferase